MAATIARRAVDFVSENVRKVSQAQAAATHPATPHQNARLGGSGGLASATDSHVPMKKTATASMSRPMTCFTNTLQGPLRGTFRTRPGRAASNR